MIKSTKSIEYAVAMQYAKAKVRRIAEKRGERAPTGLTLHNAARQLVTPNLLALARINLTREAGKITQS